MAVDEDAQTITKNRFEKCEDKRKLFILPPKTKQFEFMNFI